MEIDGRGEICNSNTILQKGDVPVRRLFRPLKRITKGRVIVFLLLFIIVPGYVALGETRDDNDKLSEQLKTEAKAHAQATADLKEEHASGIAELESQHTLELSSRDAEHQTELESLGQRLSVQTQVADAAKGLSVSRTLGVLELGCLLLNYVDEQGEYIMSVPGGEAVVLVIETNSSEIHKGVRFVDSTGIRTSILWC